MVAINNPFDSCGFVIIFTYKLYMIIIIDREIKEKHLATMNENPFVIDFQGSKNLDSSLSFMGHAALKNYLPGTVTCFSPKLKI